MTPQTEVMLAPLSTLGVGGAARWFVDAHAESMVHAALRWAHDHDVGVHVLGGGSNIVIADEGFDGLVIRTAIRGVQEVRERSRVTYQVGAGEGWDALVARSVTANCAGLECLSGIPGLVGGTPVQNVGAYGQDVSTTITNVHVVNRQTLERRVFTNAECGFGYRTSRFKRANADTFVVTAVEFSLVQDGVPTVTYADLVETLGARAAPSLQEVRDATLRVRRRKGMVIEPGNVANQSCGSFFVNPVVRRQDLLRVRAATGTEVPHHAVDAEGVKIPAAWLIERAGFTKGVRRGAVGISPYQAQAIINLGGASASEVLALACDIKRAVSEAFGISIVPEPVFVGFPQSPELQFLLATGVAVGDA